MKKIRTLIFALSIVIFLLSVSKASIIDGSPDQIAIKIAALSSQLDKMDFETIKAAALKLEAYANKKRGGLILGGLHDYIGTMGKEDFKKFCLKIALNNPELLEGEKLSAVLDNKDNTTEKSFKASKDSHRRNSNSKNRSIYHDIHDKTENSGKFLENVERLKPLKFGGLHDYIFKKDRKTLIKWAITAEAHFFVALKAKDEEPCGQWIYRKISQMSNEDLIKFILNMARKFPELDSATALNSLAQIYGINEEIVNFVSNPNNFKDKEFHNEKENEILNNKTSKPESSEKAEHDKITLINDLNNKETIEGNLHEDHYHHEFSSKYHKHSHSHSHAQHHVENAAGNLHDFISSGDRETLIKWALTAEAHSHRNLEKKPIGGLHDYITSLTNDEIGKYITIAAKRMPELNSKEKMDLLAVKYGISDESVKELAKVVHKISYENENANENISESNNEFGNKSSLNEENLNGKETENKKHCDEDNDSLQHCILHHDRKTLVKWALVAEAVLNANAGRNILGGLHDHIDNLSSDELGKYIGVAAKNHPELNDKEHMEKLAEQFGIHTEKGFHKNDEDFANKDKEKTEEKQNLSTRMDLIFSEFMAEDRKDLISWAFAAEKYDREKHGFHQLEGGLEDYIWKLDKDAIVDYIADKARTYPELKDKSFLEFLSRKYGYKKE